MNERHRTYDSREVLRYRRNVLDTAKGYEGDPAIRSVIEELRGEKRDFALMQGIWDKKLQKARVIERRLLKDLLIAQLSPRLCERLGVRDSVDMTSAPRMGVIMINDEVMGVYRKREDGDERLKIAVLDSFVHEVGHTISYVATNTRILKRNVIRHSVMGVNDQVTHIRKGLKFDWRTKDSLDRSALYLNLYGFLNEAINDDMAEEITREYVSATRSVSNEALDRYFSEVAKPDTRYGQARRFLQAVAKKIAHETGVTEQAVRDGFQRSFLEGVDFMRDQVSGEMRPLFDEATAEGFTRDLGRVETYMELEKFIEKYDLNSFFEPLENRFKQNA